MVWEDARCKDKESGKGGKVGEYKEDGESGGGGDWRS